MKPGRRVNLPIVLVRISGQDWNITRDKKIYIHELMKGKKKVVITRPRSKTVGYDLIVNIIEH